MCKHYIIKWPIRRNCEADPQYLTNPAPLAGGSQTSWELDDALIMDRKTALEWLAANWDKTIDGYEPELCRVRLEEA
jgi:hypothetical protein